MNNFDIILEIAKNIETGGEPYSGAANYMRNGKWIPREQCWELLSQEDKDKRMREAQGAWTAIQNIGVDLIMARAAQAYFDEK